MKHYFQLQLKRSNRYFKGLGIHPILAYSGSCILFVGISIILFNRFENTAYFYPLIAVYYIFHFASKEKNDFIHQIFNDKNFRKIRFIEHLIIVLPFALFLTIYNQYIIGISLIIIAIMATYFPFHYQSGYTLPSPFYKYPFEFPSGFRKTFWVYLLAYILTGIGISVGNFNLGIFAMLIIFLSQISYYYHPENEHFVWIHQCTPRTFLRKKISTAILYCSLSVSPIILLLIIMRPEFYYIIIITMIIGYIYLISIILAKYSNYPLRMNIPQELFITLGVFFPPLLFFIIPFFYKQSIKKLSAYL